MIGAIKLVIMSDSHGDFRSVYEIVERHINEKCIFIHLGDGAREVEDLRMLYTNIDLRSVSGNCDFYSMDPTEAEICHDGKKVFFTHGHTYGVKYSDRELKNAARARGASLVIHGHTHIPKEDYDDGLYVLCPGSVSRNRTGGSSYAVVEVGAAGVLTNIIKL